MNQLLGWIKGHKFVTLLLFVVGYFLLKDGFGVQQLSIKTDQMMPSYSKGSAERSMGAPAPGVAMMESLPYPVDESPPTDTPNRMVVRDTSVSLQVINVSQTIERIEQIATDAEGYLVESHLSIPEGAASGTITIRLPVEKRGEVLSSLKRLAIKVVSESVTGRDVTDQYFDLEARLAVLNKTKEKFEEILDRAVTVQDLLNVQRELVNLQSQIDSFKGQQTYLAQTAKLTKITVYLATDEFALPYTPDQLWRPEVIFKSAVRSLVSILQMVGTLLIWIVIFAPIWLPIALFFWWRKKH